MNQSDMTHRSLRHGDRINHQAYGTGTVLETDGSIVRILWDYPELSRWPGEDARETFWTDISDVFILEEEEIC